MNPRELSAYAELLCSYGEQLRFLRVDEFSEDALRRLVTACPRMKCEDQNALRPDLSVLETSLRKVRMFVRSDIDVNALATDMESCSAIEDIKLHANKHNVADSARGLLMFDKTFLASFNIIMVSGWGDDGLWELSQKAENLRTFSFAGNLFDLDALQAIADGAPRLEMVTIFHGVCEDIRYLMRGMRPERLTDTVRIFVECPNLIYLEVSFNNKEPVRLTSVVDLVCPLRVKGKRRKKGNGVRVLVEGIDYIC